MRIDGRGCGSGGRRRLCGHADQRLRGWRDVDFGRIDRLQRRCHFKQIVPTRGVRHRTDSERLDRPRVGPSDQEHPHDHPSNHGGRLKMAREVGLQIHRSNHQKRRKQKNLLNARSRNAARRIARLKNRSIRLKLRICRRSPYSLIKDRTLTASTFRPCQSRFHEQTDHVLANAVPIQFDDVIMTL
ncbi:hypothetical protein RRSWK_03479 [Rhodopirellula sp. SWK7]|nr:hypothetical protein RRSWK_03479 [Rhodopirellula sp. SWK7]